mmetsp:Transcript_74014/g.216839  ORF Transcript_74014/g.216839 Transcript_74014/m.216839 type:complete len:872 (-) Transcript_74014:99-2714(-)
MAAEAAVAAATGMGLFGYNRANYMFDAEFRFERFCATREYGNQQSEQYRNDIRNMAAYYATKNALWATTASLCMALCVACYCAGRLGLHGPSPMAWLIGLWYLNTASAFGYMAICIWLSMHSGFRARAAATHLLTRKVRLPVPTLKQLDRARKFASEFEQQNVSDILRVPYFSNNGAPKTDSAHFEEPTSKGGRSRSAPASRRTRPSSWIREEFREDYSTEFAGTIDGPSPEIPVPEHFQMFAAIQETFYQYDVYARICIFLGFECFLNGLCYYGFGQINIELRAFWVAYATVFVIAVLLGLILRFDIIPDDGTKKHYLPHCEWLGPLATLPAGIACSLDFAVEFDMTSVTFCWILIVIAYVMELIFALRILELIIPDSAKGGKDMPPGTPGGPQLIPKTWSVPTSFYHVIYQVLPPTKLQPGQNDIVREIKKGNGGIANEVINGEMPASSSKASSSKGSASSSGSEDETGETKRFHSPSPAWAQSKDVQPWKLVVAMQAVQCVGWVFLIFGNLVDIAIGEQGLVTAPHWSRPPMSRQSMDIHELGTPIGLPWAAAENPFIPEQMAWHEEKRHVGIENLGRRLQETHSQVGFSQALQNLVATVQQAEAGPKIAPEPISWPSFFEPQLLACGPNGALAAFTPRGFGSAVQLGGPRTEIKKTMSIQLGGLMHLPPLVGAHWGNAGLTVVTRHGHLAHCPGSRPLAGSWACGPAEGAPAKLPVPEGARLAAAAATWINGKLHAAMIDEAMPDLVALFTHEQSSWMPMGEMPVPRGQSGRGARASLSFVGDGDLLVATDAGAVLRRRMHDGAIIASAMHSHAEHKADWQGACGIQHESASGVAHLRLREALHAVHPEVIAVELIHGAAGKPLFFQ